MTTVLLVHNRYQQPGGEDAAVEADSQLLTAAGHRVVRYERDNDEIEGLGAAGRLGVAAGTVWSRRSRREIDRLLQRERPDVLHAHNTFPLISPAVFAAARARRIPVVQTLHNYRLVCASAVLYRDGHPCYDCVGRALPVPAVVHRCYHESAAESAVVATYGAVHRGAGSWRRLVTRYLAVSAHLSRVLTDAGAIPADRTEVRHNVCAPDPGPRASGPDEGTIVFAGRITVEKGVEDLVRAAAVASSVPIIVAGDGPHLAAAARLAAELGATNVRFVGHLERPALFDVIRRSRAVVFSSTWEEPFPMALVEAAALGVPAIATDVGGVPEIVTEQTGTLVVPGDPRALAAAMLSAIADPAGWAARGRAARTRYEAEFGADRALDRLLGAYRRAGVPGVPGVPGVSL